VIYRIPSRLAKKYGLDRDWKSFSRALWMQDDLYTGYGIYCGLPTAVFARPIITAAAVNGLPSAAVTKSMRWLLADISSNRRLYPSAQAATLG
jgi:hypothetical protein